MQRKFSRAISGLMAVFVLVTTAAAPVGSNLSGFKTAQSSMITTVMADVEVTPILTVGDVLPSGFRFESVPDGISLRTRGQGRVDVFVNHETSKVPFPYVTANPTEANSENDFDNAQVSQLVFNQQSGGVLSGSFAIKSSEGYQRFCSNYLATSKEGFDRDILFTNEEAIDYVFRQENSWPPPIGHPDEKQVGLVVALDVQTGKHHPIYGMGRHNHENSVPIPGYDDLVVLSGDDTFTNGPLTGGIFPVGFARSQSQLYSYIAPDTDSLLADEGDLWAFVSDDPAFDDYYDFTPNSVISVSGQFVQVPKVIATGIHPDTGAELKSSDMEDLGFGVYPPPPSDASNSWQRDNRITTPTGLDGPQWVLEYWSQTNNVFRFVRVEDIAYDKHPGFENVVYVVDSGRGSSGQGAGISTNGRVWRMVLDPDDPTVVTSLSVFLEGDDKPVKKTEEVHQPDNIETTLTGILLTEDPGSSQQFTPAQAAADPVNATTARLMFVPFTGGALGTAGTPQTVVKVDQSLDGDVGYDLDGRPDGNLGAWESSGIVDASAAFGPGAFLIDVQAATLWVDRAPGFDTFIDANSDPDFTFKRAGGQLLLLIIPGL